MLLYRNVYLCFNLSYDICLKYISSAQCEYQIVIIIKTDLSVFSKQSDKFKEDFYIISLGFLNNTRDCIFVLNQKSQLCFLYTTIIRRQRMVCFLWVANKYLEIRMGHRHRIIIEGSIGYHCFGPY